MATKTQSKDAGIKQENPDADVHHIVRKIGVQQTPDGTITADQADAYIRTWLQAGYTLAFVEALGLEPGGVNVLYILTRNA